MRYVLERAIVKTRRKCCPYDQKETKTSYFVQVKFVYRPSRLSRKKILEKLTYEQGREDGTAELLEDVDVELPGSI
jgi:hypothetical protein